MRRKTASTWFQSMLMDARNAFVSSRSERIALFLIAFLLWCLMVLQAIAQQQR